MPFYDYLCTACGQVFEALTQPGEARDNCPGCGSRKVSRQVVSRVAVRTSSQRRGRVVDLSSGSCPCRTHTRAHR
jgi:putative FmdB family regulatory protein